MRFGAVKWGVLGVLSLVGAFSCSGKSLNEVGDVNSSGGQGGSNVAGDESSGGRIVGRAGSSGGARTSGGGGQGGSIGNVAGGLGFPAGAGGEAGQQPESGCPGCTLVASGQDIRGADANDQKVVWAEHGTSDKLGNYNGDGRLLVRGLDGGATSVLASSLGGPLTVGLSANYAYVSLDQRDDANLPTGVARVPLAGGPLEALANGDAPQAFFTTPDYEYWNSSDGVSRVAQTDGAQLETFFPNPVGEIFAIDDTRLYFVSGASTNNAAFGSANSIWTIPLTGGDATKLTNYPGALLYYPGWLLQLRGDYLYGIEHLDGGVTYLTRLPKAGGTWKRIADAHNGTTWANIAVDGDHYLVDEQTDDLRWIFRSTLTAPNTTLDWEDTTYSLTWRGWLVTRVGIFFANRSGLYVTPIAP